MIYWLNHIICARTHSYYSERYACFSSCQSVRWSPRRSLFIVSASINRPFFSFYECIKKATLLYWLFYYEMDTSWSVINRHVSTCQSVTLSPRWNLFIMVLNPRLSAASRCRWPFLHCWTKCQERKPLETEEEEMEVEIEGWIESPDDLSVAVLNPLKLATLRFPSMHFWGA